MEVIFVFLSISYPLAALTCSLQGRTYRNLASSPGSENILILACIGPHRCISVGKGSEAGGEKRWHVTHQGTLERRYATCTPANPQTPPMISPTHNINKSTRKVSEGEGWVKGPFSPIGLLNWKYSRKPQNSMDSQINFRLNSLDLIPEFWIEKWNGER